MSIILKSIIEICVGSIVISLTVAGWIALLLCFCKWIEKKCGTKTEQPTTGEKAKEALRIQKMIQKMLKNKYGIVPIEAQPTEEKEESAE